MDNKDLIKEIEEYFAGYKRAKELGMIDYSPILLLHKCKTALQSQAIAPITSDEGGDMPYKHDSDALEKAAREIKAWKETAEFHCNNEFFYRGIVEKIGEMFEPDCYISNDGSVQQDVLALKVPELVAKALKQPAPSADGREEV